MSDHAPSTADHLLEALFDDVAQGRLPSVQIAVAREGEIVLDTTIGADDDARYQAFSLAKPVVAGLVARLFDEGVLTPGLRVADVVPGFADNGKQDVTVDHLLLHTAGFPNAPMRLRQGGDRATRYARMSSWRMDWPAGTATAYHATSAHWALASVIEEVTGRPLRTQVNELMVELGLPDMTLGGDDPRIRDVEIVGDPTPPDVLAALAEQGFDLEKAVGEAAATHALAFNDPDVREIGVPGGGLVTTARSMVAYMSRWLAPGGAWHVDTAIDFRSIVRNDLIDRDFRTPAHRTRGFVLAGSGRDAAARGFGSGVSATTFGHGGAGGQMVWCDPDSKLSLCLLTDGFEQDPLASLRRVYETSTAVAALAV